MKKESHRSNWILYLASILLCLTLFSVHLTSGLYARYSTTTSGSDEARVARFSIVQSGNLSKEIVLDVYPGYNAEHTIVLTNESEVALNYTVTVERLTENLPLTLTWNGTAMTKQGESSGVFAANGGETVTYTLNVAWSSTNNAEALSYELDALRVIVRAEQID